MRFLATLALCVWAASVQAQQPVNQTVGGKREGLWRFSYADGKPMAEEHYRNGELDGKAIGYFPDGRVSSKENWAGGSLEDSAWYYHPTGALHRKGRYEGSLYEGTWLSYDGHDRLSQRLAYHKGQPDGTYEAFDSLGRLTEAGAYIQGKEQGPFRFYQAGAVFCDGNYENGAKAGTWVYYKPNGKVKRREHYQP